MSLYLSVVFVLAFFFDPIFVHVFFFDPVFVYCLVFVFDLQVLDEKKRKVSNETKRQQITFDC